MEVLCELNIALWVLKEEVPYKYTVFSPRSVFSDSPYEFIHDAPSHINPANRTLHVPEELRISRGMLFLVVLSRYFSVYGICLVGKVGCFLFW